MGKLNKSFLSIVLRAPLLQCLLTPAVTFYALAVLQSHYKSECAFLRARFWHKISNMFFPNKLFRDCEFYFISHTYSDWVSGGLHQLLTFTPLLYITIFFNKCYIFFEYFLISLKYCIFKY